MNDKDAYHQLGQETVWGEGVERAYDMLMWNSSTIDARGKTTEGMFTNDSRWACF